MTHLRRKFSGLLGARTSALAAPKSAVLSTWVLPWLLVTTTVPSSTVTCASCPWPKSRKTAFRIRSGCEAIVLHSAHNDEVMILMYWCVHKWQASKAYVKTKNLQQNRWCMSGLISRCTKPTSGLRVIATCRLGTSQQLPWEAHSLVAVNFQFFAIAVAVHGFCSTELDSGRGLAREPCTGSLSCRRRRCIRTLSISGCIHAGSMPMCATAALCRHAWVGASIPCAFHGCGAFVFSSLLWTCSRICI